MTFSDPRFQTLHQLLSANFEPDQIITNEAKRLAYGTDASFYRLIPQLVLKLHTLDEVIITIKECKALAIPFTFRAAGTSLSGQAISDSVLITLSDRWRHHEVLDNGHKIVLQPGVIGADANKYLAPFKRKIGPDPASINSCKIGGIAANNSSGMCCGTAQNSYQTVDSMAIVLFDGTVLNTADNNSISRFITSHPSLYNGIKALSEKTKNNTQLKTLIDHKYRLKNTTGYALNALTDFIDPIDVIEHLMIGSEGTLGFIAEITYNTVIEYEYKASAFLVFADIEEASRAVTTLAHTPVQAVELLDGRALRSVSNKEGLPHFIKELDLESCALLIETHASNQVELDTQCQTVMASLATYNILESISYTSDPTMVATLWGIRKGTFPAVGAVREVGTTVIIEDVAFPVEDLANGIRDLQALFEQYHYDEAIIFGHALDGNLHFVFTQSFEDSKEVQRYAKFMEDVSELVAVKYKGSLKAEHGTGRNMAPFIELEWGKEGYALMQEIKSLFDPDGLINPGVIINDDKESHIKHLKPMPKADPLVDRCIECGFCEAVCPSRTLSLTPRQRIVLYREIQSRLAKGEDISAQELEKVFEYQGIDTCAATGLCAERCPVGINTGDLIKQLRTAKYRKYEKIAHWTANHFSTTTKMAQVGLKANQVSSSVIGPRAVETITNGLNKITKGAVPKWILEIPQANTHNVESRSGSPSKHVVYFPSCAARTMGAQKEANEQRSLTEVTQSLLTKSGYTIIIPKGLQEQCCGMPYASKGMTDLAKQKQSQLEETLWEASNQGEYPILMDTSPCAHRSLENTTKPLSIFEPSHFVQHYLLDHLHITPTDETVMLHITCSTKKMGVSSSLLTLAKACSNNVIVPEHIECCGWAGDKGFTHPELNASAVAPLKQQVPKGCQRGFSNSRTCEIGLSHHSGIPYQSILCLLDEVSQPRP
ncbi:FAD-binding oxidoreductase [Vibrio sp.]|nr:FAD-binding oxidoreductase [Vibrio sp.]